MENKKKKKSKSLSRKLKEIKNNRDEWRYSYLMLKEEYSKLNLKINELRKLVPLKYYKIEFKMKSKSGDVISKVECHEGYTYQHAIDRLKINKIYPDSFELINIEVMT